MFSFKPKSKNFKKLKKILNEQGEFEADKWFDSLKETEQIRLIEEARIFLMDQDMQMAIAYAREKSEKIKIFNGFSKN